MQATGFKLPLATYLVLPEAELTKSLRGAGLKGVELRSKQVSSEPLALAGNCSARRGVRVRPEAGGRGGVAEALGCSSSLHYLHVALLLLKKEDPRPR